ncbi:MAG: OmpA/MotB family protein [Pirellulaceae bacterium]
MSGKHGGGAWKVAYADFVTAMMAFFMVMWLVSQGQDVKEAVAEHFRDPTGMFSSGGALLSPVLGTFPKEVIASSAEDDAKNKKRSTGAAKSDSSTAFSINRGDRTRMGTAILYDEDTAELNEEGKKKLDELVPLLAGTPQKIEIRGHASRRPLAPDSPYQDAWQLSYTRCVTAMNYLVEHGLPAERIRLSQAGPFEPFTIGADPLRLKNNSCVEVFLLADMTSSFLGTDEERKKQYVPE